MCSLTKLLNAGGFQIYESTQYVTVKTIQLCTTTCRTTLKVLMIKLMFLCLFVLILQFLKPISFYFSFICYLLYIKYYVLQCGSVEPIKTAILWL